MKKQNEFKMKDSTYESYVKHYNENEDKHAMYSGLMDKETFEKEYKREREINALQGKRNQNIPRKIASLQRFTTARQEQSFKKRSGQDVGELFKKAREKMNAGATDYEAWALVWSEIEERDDVREEFEEIFY